MKRELGLAGVVVTVVGYVIGASIFVLPGQLAGATGPAVVLAYGLAAVIAVFSCIVAAQLGSVFPKTGAGYVAIARLVSPMGGFVTIWLMLAVYILAIALIASGFADYFTRLFPAVNSTVAAYGVVLFFGIINLGGARRLVNLQTLLVLIFMVALVAVSLGGIAAVKAENITPFLPLGMKPVMQAVVPAFFSYGGFMVVMELAGEIRKPARTIPFGLLLSFVVVLVTYLCLSLALVGSIPWQTLATLRAPVSHLAEILFGEWGGTFVAIAAVGAAATSVNALILVASRDIIALAEAGIFSEKLRDGDGGESRARNSVILVVFFSVVALMLGQTVMEYAVWVSGVTLLYQVIIGVAMLRILAREPEAYAAAGFKLGKAGLLAGGVGVILISGLFLYFVLEGSELRIFAALAYLITGISYYLLRKRKVGIEGWV
ncbi:APC family permease [Emcibacter nanhaiensis]|uniref:Amino acid permease n=1 Tax=Emcibacter nanhaiensis TaxID=1505037 RepID=A0A501PJS6_9PROT|nr:APC family permease [Emcibacter nanhaiensis]TPD60760.1 amino acid permease [Emcibacter nanhaiensis]